MKKLSGLAIVILLLCACSRTPILNPGDRAYLEDLTRAVVDSSRILPGQELPPAIRSFGPNRTGITLIRPGGRDCYPSFWIRDYAMSLESGFITPGEQREILLFTASRQSDSTWTTKTGSRVPAGSIPDHIRIGDGRPVYFPGTYDYVSQGSPVWRQPPFCDQFFFIHMAWWYLKSVNERNFLQEQINEITLYDRLVMAFNEVPSSSSHGMAFISDSLPTCDFGFRDVIQMTGEVCFGSILRYRAALELAQLSESAGAPEKAVEFRAIARRIKSNLITVFGHPGGLLKASTGLSAQPDVWATAFAIHTGILTGSRATWASKVLVKAYQSGTLTLEGQIRHVLTTDDFSPTTAWEKALCGKNMYQNGAYWGTATGWVCSAMARTDRNAARQLATDYIAHLKKADFRLPGPNHGGPYECIYPPTGHYQNAVYMTSVSVPFGILREF